MRLIGKARLTPLFEKDRSMGAWTKSWVADISNAHWKSETEISNRFPHSLKISKDLFFFLPNQGIYGIEVKFAFLHGIALIKDVKKSNG